jgi:hypothetical protein
MGMEDRTGAKGESMGVMQNEWVPMVLKTATFVKGRDYEGTNGNGVK